MIKDNHIICVHRPYKLTQLSGGKREFGLFEFVFRFISFFYIKLLKINFNNIINHLYICFKIKINNIIDYVYYIKLFI